METLIQQIINALALGGTYALLALGVGLVFNIMNLINFAHGELMTVAGYTVFYVGNQAGMPFFIAALAALAAAGLLAVLMERIAFRPLRGANAETLMLASLALSILIQVLLQGFISARPQAVHYPAWLTGTVSLGSIQVAGLELLAIGVTAVLLAALGLFLRYTTLGLSMRSAAHDFPTTRLMGVNANRVFMVAFAISGVLAGLAGLIWVGQKGEVDPFLGVGPVLSAFIAAIVGGLGTLSGPVVGGFLLAFIEVGLQGYLPDGLQPYQSAISILIVVGILAIRPAGLIPPGDGGKVPVWERLFARARRSAPAPQ